MRAPSFIILIVILCLTGEVLAQNPTPKAAEPMKTIEVGDGSNLVIPEGMRIQKIGAQVIVEDPHQYLIGQFQALEARMKKMETSQAEFKNNLKEITDQITALQALLKQIQLQQAAQPPTSPQPQGTSAQKK